MRTLPFSASALLPFLLTPSVSSLPTEDCPILGPIFPPSAYDIRASSAFASAVENFPTVIEALFEAGVINRTGSTFALDVYSTRTNESIYSYYHLAEGPGSTESLTAGVLNDQTVFRTGSVSKLHTVYSLLAVAKSQGKGNGGLDIFGEKVVKYIPELALSEGEEEEDASWDSLARIKWDQVTIGALASHEGGIGGPSSEMVGCGCNATACNLTAAPACADAFMQYLRDEKHPVHPIYQTPTYSDAGFVVLTRVLERMTNLTYDEAVKKYLGEPLGLNVTSSVAREAQEANAFVIPGGILGGSNWAIDNQVVAGSGGIYANARELRKLGLSILNNEILDPRATKQWMKPLGNTASPYKSVGAPWEIERLAIPVSPNSNRTRISDQYTKAGGQPGYTSVLLLSPDHGLGYSVLVGGPRAGADRWPLRAALGEAFVPAAEWAGYEQANATWPGTYTDSSVEGTNITLALRPDHPGVTLESMFVAGVDWRGNLSSPGMPFSEEVFASFSIQVYPTGLAETGENGSQRLSFFVVPTVLPHVFPSTRNAIEGGDGLFDNVCFSPFGTIGFFDTTEGPAIDEFVFVFDAHGGLQSVEYPAVKAKFVPN